MGGRAAGSIELSDEERCFPEARLRRHKAERSLSDRCRIVPRCVDGLAGKQVAAGPGHAGHTVGKWRRRCAAHRIEGVSDEYRAGRPRTIPDVQVAEIIEQTLETTPRDATHWSIRSMAAETGYSHSTIRRIWNAFGLQSHRSATFKLSTDPLFADKVQDIVGLYMSPPNRAIVLCADDKSQIQALERGTAGAADGAERRPHTYIRHGTTSLFAARDIATGAVIGKCHKRHRATEFLDVLKKIDAAMPDGPEVHLVRDTYATHKTPRVKAWLARRPHRHVHVTPPSASRINQVERWVAELTRKQLQRGVHRSTAELQADIAAVIKAHNENPKPYRWIKSADEI